MTSMAVDPDLGALTPGGLGMPFAADDAFLPPPDDLYGEDVFDPDWDDAGPHPYDELPPMSRVDALEWELWAGVEQDDAERTMLELKAPAWVFLAPGAELAASLEELRPQCESPVALIEAM